MRCFNYMEAHMSIKRIFVEKKEGFNVEAHGLLDDLKNHLNMTGLEGVRILHRYDTDHLDDTTYEQAIHTIYSEPPVDVTYEEVFPMQEGDVVLEWNTCPDNTTNERIPLYSVSSL